MPTIQAFIMEGHDAEAKARLIAGLTQAVVETVDAPPESVCVLIDEVARANFGVAGKPADADTPGRAVLQAFLIAGRSDAQKERLIARLSAAVAAIGVDPAVVRVFIQDLPNTDFGLGGRTALALGRGIGRAALVHHG
ncbi:2-hydroxymuconate tautomerase family protein [Massilia sp. HP4]|uniref:2-hydroxymuconate tautomerase family protein n=1 Tax=Massilia sp. HP4 TaxID=2562316 RepID=UPI0010C1296F|nr:2-hydroxymuconate tautomerase family protein [Massilia sp. HP4]